MKYRYKFKGQQKQEEPKVVRTSLTAKRRMLFLLVWGGLSVGLYFGLSRYYAMTPVIVSEVLLFAGLAAYLVNNIRIRKELVKNGEQSERLVSLLDKSKYILIFIIPLIFIVMFDFIVTTVKMA